MVREGEGRFGRLRRERGGLVSVAIVLLVILPLLLFAALMLSRGRDHALATARSDVEDLARVAAFVTAQSLNSVDEVMLGLMFNPPVTDPKRVDGEVVRGIASFAVAGAKGIDDLFIADGKGARLNGAVSGVRRTGATRPFVPSVDGLAAGMSISHAFESGDEGRWSVYASRPLKMADGAVDWVVAEVPIAYFVRAFNALIDRDGLSIILSRGDDRIIATAPLDSAQLGGEDPAGRVFAAGLGEDATPRAATVANDAQNFMWARHRVAGYPLVVSARIDVDLALEPFRRQTLRDLALIGLMIALIVALGYGLYRAEVKYRGADALLSLAIDGMSEGFVLFDAQERFVLCNDKFRTLYPSLAGHLRPGMSHNALLRLSAEAGAYTGVTDVDDFIRSELALFRAGGPSRERRLSNGRWLQLSERKMSDGGTVAVHTDITPLREQQEALIRATDELARAKSVAEAANVSKSRFLATMSHELRTPLNAIIGFAEIIRDQLFGRAAIDQYSEYAADISSSGELLLSLINDVLDMSKIEANKFVVEPQKIDLAAALHAAANMVRARALERGVELIPAPRTSISAFADPRSVKQIALNLLTNAIKFTRSGGTVRVEIDPPKDGKIEFRVVDNGIGMTERELKICMEPFGQAHNALTREQSGTGLGLPISASLAELNGGRLTVTSVRDVGTTVTVVLLVTPPADRFDPDRLDPDAELEEPVGAAVN